MKTDISEFTRKIRLIEMYVDDENDEITNDTQNENNEQNSIVKPKEH